MIAAAHWQTQDELVDIADWFLDEEYPTFPEGSRDKQLLRCPQPVPRAWLIAGHRYLFKKSRNAYPAQFWAEVVASRLGRICGVPVPPAYAAWDSRNGTCAALIEWFWGYSETPFQGFVSGGMFMQGMIENFDHKKGTQHNFQHIVKLCEVLSSGEHRTLDKGWQAAWARMLTFDALIGNTDRHQENWGLVFTRTPGRREPRLELSPAFDNGTSMGHEHHEANLDRFNDPNYLARYIRKGYHHMRWRLQDKRRSGHLELLQKLSELWPACRYDMLTVLEFDPAELEEAIMPLTQMTLPTPLSHARARYMLKLLTARRLYLLNHLCEP